VLCLVPGAALAQATPAPSVIQNNNYALELFQGPLIAPNRITGMAGAYTALADDVDGVTANAAAPAVREPFSNRWFDLSVTSGVSLPGGYAGTDFTNRGENGTPGLVNRTNQFLYANLGLRLQFGSFGATATGELLRYQVSPAKEGVAALQLIYARTHTAVAYGFWDNQIVIGAGLRGITAQLSPENVSRPIMTMTGFAPEIGGMLKLNDAPFRVGGTVRAGVQAKPIGPQGGSSFDSVRAAGDLVLPDRILQPWELELGIAWQFGARPLNPRWQNPRDQSKELRARIEDARRLRAAAAFVRERGRRSRAEEIAVEQAKRAVEEQELAAEEERLYAIRAARYRNWPREHLLFLASALITGPSVNAVALDGFLDQRLEYVGRQASFAPRVGVEAEPVPNRVRVRFGGYLEPSRFSDGTRRQHFTVGTDIRLFAANPLGLFPEAEWAMVLMYDLAPRYQNYGIGLTAWH